MKHLTFEKLYSLQYRLLSYLDSRGKKLLRNSIDLSIRSNDDNHKINDYETESTYVSSRKKNLHGTCYGSISNISFFDLIKGVPNKLLLKYGIRTTLRPLTDEKIPLKPKQFNTLFNLFKKNRRQLLKVRKNGLLHRSLKKATL
jgi:hypothetical protein